ncbi:MAG: UDP-N-acetylmuramoyl-L-alanyl-D-glutamate--2,6-diaminopimelate ligase [Bacteroidota bacterium]
MSPKPVDLLELLEGFPIVKFFNPLPAGPSFARRHINPSGGGLDIASGGELRVSGVAYDSRQVKPGNLFIAIRGEKFDGHQFVADAINRGARAIVIEESAEKLYPDSLFAHSNAAKIVVAESRKALAHIANRFYRNAASKLRIIGVTGTNGKTTTTFLLQSILQAAGEQSGLLGTIEYRIGDEVRTASHTTPESLDLHALFAEMVERGTRWVVMEVSSHALALDRVYGISFEAAVFTNLTQDHLDFHRSMEAYFAEKKKLFDRLPSTAKAITNADDEYGQRIIETTPAMRYRYGLRNAADVRAENISTSLEGISFDVLFHGNRYQLRSPLVGRFNVENVLAATAAAFAVGVPFEAIQSGVRSVSSVRGRFEPVPSPEGWIAIVDYAHTPDALEKCLRAIHELMPAGVSQQGRIITVFGAGGNRDRTKRPKMGRVASELSDVVIITSDNPRNEDPQQIIEEISAGTTTHALIKKIVNRREAIEYALSMATAGDVVLVAGKGHEREQIIGNQVIPFSDRDVVEEYIREHSV